MAKALNFDRHRPPTLPIELGDGEESFLLRVTPPTVDLQEELRARRPDLQNLMTEDTEGMREALYDLAARMMSCNRNLRRITAEDLRTKYALDEADLAVFFDAYTEFLTDLEHAKN